MGGRSPRGFKKRNISPCDNALRDEKPASVKNCPTAGSAWIF